ncbi:hypothetical protein [Aerococcus sanguinicola]|uniref:hypothetical protein n=1 Tax=Aerococcus sanguinicola TaxID=119206 RepID=UPI0018A76E8C|nr:hypothetical protein [Aerococcus sanguinicola]
MEEKENKKKKSLLWLLLFLLLGVTIGGVYTYWVGNVGGPNDQSQQETVVIGEGESIATQLDVSKTLANEGKKLVPQGKANVSVGGTEQNVESFQVTYTVKWQESGDKNIIDADDAINRTLSVTGTGEIEGAQAANNELVNLSIDPSTAEITADGEAVEVRVTVTLTEPRDKAQYYDIVGKNILVNLNFSVE